jgi:peptidoglycan/xylan/chitin deacetylase (PgdA/CDA1 family)
MPDFHWPADLDPHTVCFTVDVEWAADEVLDDLRRLFDQHGVRATFFVTHAGVDTPGHERGLHPNFRRNGDTHRKLRESRGGDVALGDDEINAHVMATTLAFAPEAKGLRSHSLYYDSTLLPLYSRLGLEYDCSYQMPLLAGLRPFWKQHDIVEIPTFYADHFDIMTGATGFEVAALGLDRPGLKVFDFHPNIVFLNSSRNDSYLSTKSFYHDHERLLGAREQGKGARTLLLDLLNAVAKRRLRTATVGEVNAAWRNVAKWT